MSNRKDINQLTQLFNTMTKLMECSWEGNVKCVEDLINNNRETLIINTKDDNGLTALHWAVIGKHAEIVKILLENGADKTIQSKKGETALDIAIEKKNSGIVDLLKNNPSEVYSPLHFPVNKGGKTKKKKNKRKINKQKKQKLSKKRK
jgi:ankyrin repeat protein